MRSAGSILGQIGRTPLVALERISAGRGVPLFANCVHLNPGGSIKDRIALAIVEDAEQRGLLRPGATLIEATAGNTGVGLALVAAARGYALVCVLPEKMSVDQRVALASLGAKVGLTANAPPSSPENFRNVAQRMAVENGWFLTDQFNNPANVRVHEQTTAAEILEQTQGRVGAFVAGAGTGGTLTGVGRRLKSALPRVRIVLADPVGSGLADWVETGKLGPDGSYAVEGIGGSEAPANLHRDVIDLAERVSDAESFAMVKRLVREEGLLVGGLGRDQCRGGREVGLARRSRGLGSRSQCSSVRRRGRASAWSRPGAAGAVRDAFHDLRSSSVVTAPSGWSSMPG
jgi:cysteine synthase